MNPKKLKENVQHNFYVYYRDKEYLSQAISNGAEGYLLKEDVGEQLLFAIEMIRGGRVYVPPFP